MTVILVSPLLRYYQGQGDSDNFAKLFRMGRISALGETLLELGGTALGLLLLGLSVLILGVAGHTAVHYGPIVFLFYGLPPTLIAGALAVPALVLVGWGSRRLRMRALGGSRAEWNRHPN